MTRSIVLLAVWLATTSHAIAAWNTVEFRSGATGKLFRVASLTAETGSSPITATLSIDCRHSSGDRYVWFRLSEKREARASLSWRVDKGPVQNMDIPYLVGRPATSAELAIAPKTLTRAKRVHVEWHAANGTHLSYDFDVSGAKKAIAYIPCVKAKEAEF